MIRLYQLKHVQNLLLLFDKLEVLSLYRVRRFIDFRAVVGIIIVTFVLSNFALPTILLDPVTTAYLSYSFNGLSYFLNAVPDSLLTEYYLSNTDYPS